MINTDPELVLRLALDRDPVATLAALGISQVRVSQEALRFSEDPRVQREHPLLVQQVRARIEAGRENRRWR